MALNNTTIKFEIVSHIGTLSTSKSNWTTELNLVSWNDKEPKYDIRAWSPDHSKMGKGVTLTSDEILQLKEVLADIDGSESDGYSSRSEVMDEDHSLSFDDENSAYYQGGGKGW